ncbi:response regulator [Roseateles cavernae]|uniref:response regulator n=1 Tax=Roseateles cavernae TaxID=3153578 RepID=UPI0032E4833C
MQHGTIAHMAVSPNDDECSTLEAARMLSLAVRSVQLMVDRGELQAWKTPGGHRRISRTSVERWISSRTPTPPENALVERLAGNAPAPCGRVLLIEDSKHFQSLISMLMRRSFPEVELHVADDGVVGLAMVGRLMPDLLLVDLLLPGIDGAMLLANLRAHPQFAAIKPIVVTSLGEADRAPFAYALQNVPVVHKSRVIDELPTLLTQLLPVPAGRTPGSQVGR